MASSMTCVMGQRVVREICDHCKEEYQPPAEVAEDIRKVLGKLAPANDFKLFRGRKCPECNDTGYIGRIAVFEVLPVSEKIGRLILERRPAVDIEHQAVEEGMVLMKQDGYLKALDGITSIEEVLRVAQT